jgi:hypothetical protein
MSRGLRSVADLAVLGAALTMVPTAVEAGQFDDANRWMAKRFERVAVPEVRYARSAQTQPASQALVGRARRACAAFPVRISVPQPASGPGTCAPAAR